MLSVITLFESAAVSESMKKTFRDKNFWKKVAASAAGLAGAGLAGGYVYSQYNKSSAPKNAIVPSVPNISIPQDLQLNFQIPAAEKEPASIGNLRPEILPGIKIRDYSGSQQNAAMLPEISKMPWQKTGGMEEKLPDTKFTKSMFPEISRMHLQKIGGMEIKSPNNMIDQRDREINNLVLKTLDI